MKSLFIEADYNEIRKRIESLTKNNQRKWGKMEVAQMLAHCSIGFEIITGKLPFEDKSNLITRTLVKSIVLNLVNKGKFLKNQRTFSIYRINDDRDFETERARLLESLDNFYRLSLKIELGPHPYFGKLSKEEWGTIQYLHTHHHLMQFSA